jgi:hypothetical protein
MKISKPKPVIVTEHDITMAREALIDACDMDGVPVTPENIHERAVYAIRFFRNAGYHTLLKATQLASGVDA